MLPDSHFSLATLSIEILNLPIKGQAKSNRMAGAVGSISSFNQHCRGLADFYPPPPYSFSRVHIYRDQAISILLAVYFIVC